MSSLFNLMIDDIIISEADFSNDSFSQCQISECAPTESISSMILTKNSKLNLLKQTSAEDFFFGKLFNSPLRLTQNSKSQDQESRNQFKQKALGKLAWALFEEELSFELFNSEENYGQQQKNIDFQRNNVITSEFLLEEETEQKDTIKDLKLSSKKDINIQIDRNLAKFKLEDAILDFDKFSTPKLKKHFKEENKSNQLFKKTIKKSSIFNHLKTPKNSNGEKNLQGVLTKFKA